jgi:PPM family protein phosphatase
MRTGTGCKLPESSHFAILRVKQTYKNNDGGDIILQVATLTNRGKERPRNEDSCYAAVSGNSALLVVADGMGGHRAGNVASDLTVKAAEKAWSMINADTLTPGESRRNVIEAFILEANRQILDEADKTIAQKGMGTTVTAALLFDRHLTIGHVGDSRAYKINADTILPLTIDHSLLQPLVESGEISTEEARCHPQRHILTRALGITHEITVDLCEEEVEEGSTVLLCTDGLTNMVRDEEILAIANNHSEAQKIAEALIDLANERGGFDNITVVIATGIGGRQT